MKLFGVGLVLVFVSVVQTGGGGGMAVAQDVPPRGIVKLQFCRS